MAYENDLNLKATELRLGLPGTDQENEEKEALPKANNKRPLTETTSKECGSKSSNIAPQQVDSDAAPPSK